MADATSEFRAPARVPLVDREPLTEADFLPEQRAEGDPACLMHLLSAAVRGAAVRSGTSPKDLVLLSGLDAEPVPASMVSAYAVRGLRDRVLAFAMGLRSANPGLTVLAFGAASAGFGLGHLLEAARKNLDMTYVLLNGGTCSRAHAGSFSAEPPEPDVLSIALSAGATFCARISAASPAKPGAPTPPGDEHGTRTPVETRPQGAPYAPGAAGSGSGLPRPAFDAPEACARVLSEAMQHKGFSLVDCVGLCPVCDDAEVFGRFREKTFYLDEEGHDPADRKAASSRASASPDEWPLGVLYDAVGEPTWEQREPALALKGAPVLLPAGLSRAEREALWDHFR